MIMRAIVANYKNIQCCKKQLRETIQNTYTRKKFVEKFFFIVTINETKTLRQSLGDSKDTHDQKLIKIKLWQ